MKLAPARIDAFIRQPPDSLRAALIFGPDHGAVKLRADALALVVVGALDDPFRVAVLHSGDIAADPALLFDEMAAQSLGGGRRLVRVPQAEEKIAPALGKLTADWPATGSLLLLEAGDLDKKSKLRALAENDSPLIAAIACYPEFGEDRTRLIGGWMRDRKLKIAPDALQLLADLTPPDRLGLFSELEKLALYAGEGGMIAAADVQAALGDAAEADFDGMVMAMGDGDRAALDAGLSRLQAEAAPVAILRAAQRHMLRLYETRMLIDQGQNVREAMNKLQPRVFWKYTGQFARQAQHWQMSRLNRALVALVEAEAQCKRTGIPDAVLCRHLLMAIGSQAHDGLRSRG